MTIFFDLDDTLLDHRSACVTGAKALYEQLRPDRSLDGFVADWESSLQRQFTRFLSGELSYDQQRWERVREVVDRSLSDDAADRVFSIYVEAYEASWVLFPDVSATLDRLAEHSLGIITNGQASQQRRKAERTGLLSRMACIVVSEDVGVAKPDPALFRYACSRAGSTPVATVYVGDRYDIDAHAARQAGLQGVWLDRHRLVATAHEPPVIASLTELPALVADLEGCRG